MRAKSICAIAPKANRRARSLLASAALVLTSLTPSTLFALSDWDFDKKQAKTAVEIVKLLEQNHYNDIKLDDQLSSQFLDRFIESLDPSKLYLLQSDISGFERYRHQLDDSVGRGNLEIGDTIFKIYQKRLEQRLEWVLANLDEMLANMDYDKDESILIDRSDSLFPKNTREADKLWRKHIKNSALSLKLAKKEEDKIADVLRKRYTNRLNRAKQTNSEDAFQIFINALTQLYDPHTNYFSPRNSENFNINMRLSLEGIGAVLQVEDEYTKVLRLVPSGPAEKQGELKPADLIIGVGQGSGGEMIDVIGWRLDEVVDLIRGKKGSTVRLEVVAAGSDMSKGSKVIEIVRNKVKLEEQSAQKKVLEIPSGKDTRKVGVIELPTFYIDFEAIRRGDPNYKSSTGDVKKLLDELEQENVEGIIIDLRDNGGGALFEATALTSLFIEYGPAVQTRTPDGHINRESRPPSNNYYKKPIAVMINRMSASASEIFAGAMQDYRRGIVVGSQSFGKGTVQLLQPLQQGQLKLTQSKFYRISGDSTQHRGVIPDIQLPSLYDVNEIGESSLEYALPWDSISPVRHPIYSNIPMHVSTLQQRHNYRASQDADFQYLNSQIALINEARERKTISLSKTVRANEKKEREQQDLKLLNQRRAAKGKPAFASWSEAEETASKEEENTEKEKDTEEKDFLLVETGKILLDNIDMQNGQLSPIKQRLAENP